MRIIIIIVAGLLLASCGSKGDLYLPDGEAETKQQDKTQPELTDSDKAASEQTEHDKTVPENNSSHPTADSAVSVGPQL
jgi:predicted small lipoprotein YifL